MSPQPLVILNNICFFLFFASIVTAAFAGVYRSTRLIKVVIALAVPLAIIGTLIMEIGVLTVYIFLFFVWVKHQDFAKLEAEKNESELHN